MTCKECGGEIPDGAELCRVCKANKKHVSGLVHYRLALILVALTAVVFVVVEVSRAF